MKVLHISTLDSGGAAKSAINLHLGLLKIGVKSNFLSLYKSRDEIPNHYQFRLPERNFIDRLKNSFRYRIDQKKKRLVQNKFSSVQKFSSPETIFRVSRHPLIEEADIINLHWVADFLDYQTFFEENEKPIVWTLHDMNPFSPGYHYLTGLNTSENEILLRKTENFKKKALSGGVSSIQIVSPSQWLANESLNSRVMNGFDHHVIPYGIDVASFTVQNKEKCRLSFGIENSTKPVLLFLANHIDNPLKGFDLLLKALTLLGSAVLDQIILLIVGRTTETVRKKLDTLNCDIRYSGHLDSISRLSMAYNSADIFLMPSVEDNFPNTIIESLACGLGVLAFSIGGMKDTIIDGVNGSLVKEVTSEAYSFRLNEILHNKSWNRFNRESISSSTKEKYTLEQQATQYTKLYQKILMNASKDH